METLSKQFTRKDFDEYGRANCPDSVAAEVVTSGMGYSTKPCKVIVDDVRKLADVTFGHYGSWVTVNAFHKDS